MELYNKNMQLLKGVQPELYEKMVGYTKKDETVIVEQAKNGSITMKILADGSYKYIHSKYNPEKEAKDNINNFKIQAFSVIYMFGMGMLYHLDELILKFNEKNEIHLFEHNKDVFYNILCNIDLNNYYNKKNSKGEQVVYFHLFDNILELDVILGKYFTVSQMHRVKVYAIPSYEKLFFEQYKEFVEIIKNKQIKNAVERNTIMHFSSEWHENIISNMSANLDAYNCLDLKDIWKDKPLIIVSAGPSLGKNIELLKTLKGKAMIFAVDRAVKPLLVKGFAPDFFCTVDGQKTVFNKVKGCAFEEVPLIYASSSCVPLLQSHTGPKFVMESIMEDYFDVICEKLGKEMASLEGGGSVACYTFDTAELMGADPIVFVGQDLGYPKEYSVRHVEGASTLSTAPMDYEVKNRLETVDIYGNPLETDIQMYTYMKWFENRIFSDETDKVYIDATEGGARIKGTKVMTLKEFVDNYKEKFDDPAPVIKQLITPDKKLFSNEDKKQIIEDLNEAQKQLEDFQEELKIAVEYSDRLLKEYKYGKGELGKSVTRYLKKLEKIDKKLRNIDAKSLIGSYVKPLIYLIGLKMEVITDTADEHERSIQIAEASYDFYKGLEDTIDALLPAIQQSLHDVKEKISINIS